MLAGCAMDMGGGGGSSRPRSPASISASRSRAGRSRSSRPIRRDADSLEFAQLAAPVERELARLGWTVEPRQRPLRAGRGGPRRAGRARGAGAAASRIGIGVGGGSYGRGSGVGVGVGGTIPIGSGGAREIVGTKLSVRIQRRSDATVAWEGRAQMEARGNSAAGRQGGGRRPARGGSVSGLPRRVGPHYQGALTRLSQG